MRQKSNITNISLGQHLEMAMRRYGSYVATERAVADVRDGLKPVQRRIIWSMHELKIFPDTNFQKCAKIVGHCIGGYHVHGDSATYTTLVNMTHDRYPLIQGHGNFGGPLDPPAAMRYTEARLTPLALELLEDREVGQYVPNYSGDCLEPLMFPSRAPMILLNGSSGIGVGLAASIPPHNLEEVVRAIIYQIKSPNCRIDTLLQHIKGPDYGYGVLLSSEEEVAELYRNGKGTLKYRCEYSFEKAKDHEILVISSLAPGFNLATFLSKMKQLQDDGLIEYCSDTSSADNLRVLVGFKDAYTVKERVLPELYTSDSYQFYVVKRDGKETLDEKTLFLADLKTLIQEFIDFRREVEKARLEHELVREQTRLDKAQAILLGIKNISIVYEVLQKRYDSLEAITNALAMRLGCTKNWAETILDLKVHRLARMREDEQNALVQEINRAITSIQEDLTRVDSVIIHSLQKLLKYKDSRGTVIGVAAPKLEVTEGTKWVAVKGKRIIRYDSAPKNTNLVAECSEYAIVILENNVADMIRPHYFSELKYKDTIVGIVPDSCKKLVVLDDRGLSVAIDLPQKKARFQLIKGATKIVAVVGMCVGDNLQVVDIDGNTTIMRYDDLQTTRPFVAGKKLVKDAENLLLQKDVIKNSSDYVVELSVPAQSRSGALGASKS